MEKEREAHALLIRRGIRTYEWIERMIRASNAKHQKKNSHIYARKFRVFGFSSFETLSVFFFPYLAASRIGAEQNPKPIWWSNRLTSWCARTQCRRPEGLRCLVHISASINHCRCGCCYLLCIYMYHVLLVCMPGMFFTLNPLFLDDIQRTSWQCWFILLILLIEMQPLSLCCCSCLHIKPFFLPNDMNERYTQCPPWFFMPREIQIQILRSSEKKQKSWMNQGSQIKC